MKIAIFNDYQLPLPATRGGSVPTLTNFLLDENEKYHDFDIDVYSCFEKGAVVSATKYKFTKFIFSKDARFIRFFTNLLFVLKGKLHIPFNLSAIPLPRTAKKYFKKQQYDIIYVNAYIRGVLPIVKNARGGHVIVHHHVVTDILGDSSIQGKNILEKSARLCFVSDFARDFARKGTSEQNAKMITFPNAIDISRFQLSNWEVLRHDIRKKYHIQETDTVIIFVGRMVQSKGAIETIRAFNQSNFTNSVKLLMVGGATYSSKKITPYIEECFEEAKNNKNIIFTGHIPYSDLPPYYCASDIATLISRYDEACGLVGIESMAAGLPVITTDRGGISEYIPEDCKIVTQDDEKLVENLSSAMKKLVGDEKLREDMGATGKKHAERFDKGNYYKSFKNIIENCVNEAL